MSEDEDDYLSDKFLIPEVSTSTQHKTYAQLRKDAEKKSRFKNEQNRIKSRRQRELEARKEGLSKSLFERAKEEEDAGISPGNKALSMMKKMGFKPGQALGKVEEPVVKPVESSQNTQAPAEAGHSSPDSTTSVSGHIVKPIPLNEWQGLLSASAVRMFDLGLCAGKKGIGLGKRAASPSASAGRAAKMAKMAEEAEVISHRNFRNRARREYEEKRAEGRLVPAQRTCVTLDEKAGKTFHVLWLNPNNPDSFPEGLVDALALRGATGLPHDYHGEAIQVRLRKQMEADALHPLDDALTPKSSTLLESFSLEVMKKAMQYLRLQVE
ncbi:hypothetical protein C0989_007656 [Termitomyces sp. Mn162]|nr:hypothetical protein C0989_007656 [Termitomyces sp. Mn162]